MFFASYPKLSEKEWLIGGWTNPLEKYARQIGHLPQTGVNIEKYLKPPPGWVSPFLDQKLLIKSWPFSFTSLNSKNMFLERIHPYKNREKTTKNTHRKKRPQKDKGNYTSVN